MDATEVVQRKPALLSHRRAKKGIRRGMLGMTKRRNVADWLECPDYLWTRGVERMEEGNILLCVAVVEGAMQVGNTDWNHSLVNSRYNKLGCLTLV